MLIGLKLNPIHVIRSREDFINASKSELLSKIRGYEDALINSTKDNSFNIEGYCIPCKKKVSFLVDMQWGGQVVGNQFIPNWRERLECPL